MMNREHFAYGVLAGLGAGAVVCGVCCVAKRLWKKPANPYEAQKVVHEYMAFHYAPAEEYLVYPTGPKAALDFPQRCAQLCIKHQQAGVLSRAIDVGCAVGRSTFELARGFKEVVGIDYSRAFIQRCQQLKMTGQATYRMGTEGDLGEEKTAVVHPDIDRTRVSFMVGDGCNLPDLGQFGCVLAGNLICRLPDPIPFFVRLRSMTVPGGIVVITSPYTWLEQYTPRNKWIGGYKDSSGKEVRGFDTLQEVMGRDFELVEAVDVPFLIRETVRKHQWTVAHATVWRRKASV